MRLKLFAWFAIPAMALLGLNVITGVQLYNSQIDSTVIGSATAAAGTFSSLADTAMVANSPTVCTNGSDVMTTTCTPNSSLHTESVSGTLTGGPTQLGSSLTVSSPGACTWRVQVSYSLYLTFAGTNTAYAGFYVSDGTHSYAGTGTGQSNSTGGAANLASYSGRSNVTYSSSTSSITLSLYGLTQAGTTTINGTMPDGTTTSTFQAYGVCQQ